MTESPTAAAALPPFDAVIFDLDGVVTDTAAVHEAAWTELYEVLKDPRVPPTARRSPFNTRDYQKYVDGRGRNSAAVLAAGGLSRAFDLVIDGEIARKRG